MNIETLKEEAEKKMQSELTYDVNIIYKGDNQCLIEIISIFRKIIY